MVQELTKGETLRVLAKRYDVSSGLIRIWVRKYEAGEFDNEAEAAVLIQKYEARIAELERLVAKQALELKFIKRRIAPHPRSEIKSVLTGAGATFPE